jgi:hypothetical protein
MALGGQPLEEPLRQVRVVGVLGDPGAGDVDVDSAVVLVGPERLDVEAGVLVELLRQVVVVGDPNVAAALGDGLQHQDVAAQDLDIVGDPALEDADGFLVAVVGDQACDQRLRVDVRGVPHADPAPPFGVG